MEIPFDEGVLLTEIRRTVSAFFEQVKEKRDIYIRLQLTRGAGAIGLDVALADEPLFIILVQYLNEGPPDLWTEGLQLSLGKSLFRNHPKTLNPAWKTGNDLNNVLCLREAKARGADDVAMLNLDGAVTEASVSNIFFVSDGEILTPPTTVGILEGITRDIILNRLAQDSNWDVREEMIDGKQISEFSECFLTSTTRDIVPVGSIDKVEYAVGPKTVTSELKKIFRNYVADYNTRHPELKIFDK